MTAHEELRERLAGVLAAHQSEQLWKAGGWAGDTACSCGWRMAMWSRKDFPEVHRKHVAEVITEAVLAWGDERAREAQADGWSEGYATGIADEATSRDMTNGQVPPARVNPYRGYRADLTARERRDIAEGWLDPDDPDRPGAGAADRLRREGAVKALRDAVERMDRAVERLIEKRDDLSTRGTEKVRLGGKVEGVKLARAYVDEADRIERQEGEQCPDCGPGYRIGDDGCRHGSAALGGDQ